MTHRCQTRRAKAEQQHQYDPTNFRHASLSKLLLILMKLNCLVEHLYDRERTPSPSAIHSKSDKTGPAFHLQTEMYISLLQSFARMSESIYFVSRFISAALARTDYRISIKTPANLTFSGIRPDDNRRQVFTWILGCTWAPDTLEPLSPQATKPATAALVPGPCEALAHMQSTYPEAHLLKQGHFTAHLLPQEQRYNVFCAHPCV